MKFATILWCLCLTPFVFSTPLPGHHYYDAAKLEIMQESKVHDTPRNLPHQLSTNLESESHDAPVNLPSPPPTASDSKAHDARMTLPHHLPAVLLKETKAHDTPMNLPRPVPKTLVSNDAVGSKFLAARPPVAPLENPKVQAAHSPLRKKPLISPVSKDAAAYKDLPHKSSVALASKDDATYELLPSKSPIAPHRLSSESSDGTMEDKIFSDFDDRENSLYPGVVEAYVTEEEVREANDEVELTDDFLQDYLSNEDLDTEKQQEASNH